MAVYLSFNQNRNLKKSFHFVYIICILDLLVMQPVPFKTEPILKTPNLHFFKNKRFQLCKKNQLNCQLVHKK